jgi:hypothetical protein
MLGDRGPDLHHGSFGFVGRSPPRPTSYQNQVPDREVLDTGFFLRQRGGAPRQTLRESSTLFAFARIMSTPRDPRRRRSRHRRGPESRKRNGDFQGQEVAAARVPTNVEIAERIFERLPLPPKATPIPISVATDDKVIKTTRETPKKFGGIRSTSNMALRTFGKVESVEG